MLGPSLRSEYYDGLDLDHLRCDSESRIRSVVAIRRIAGVVVGKLGLVTTLKAALIHSVAIAALELGTSAALFPICTRHLAY